MSQRDQTVDALKGFAILLVVLGHAVQWNTAAFDYNIYFRLIYSFHMPLFIFLSGYIGWNRSVNLVKKAQTLIIPFVVWYLLDYITTRDFLTVNFGTYIIRWIISPDYGLWFLWILFLCFVLFRLLQLLPGKTMDTGVLVIIVLCLLASKYLHFYLYGIPLLVWYLPFFLTGYLIAKYREKFAKVIHPVQISSIFMFPLLVSQWMRAEQPLFYGPYHQWFVANNLHGFDFTILGYRYLTSLFGITLSFYFIKLIGNQSFYPFFYRLGLISLDIYVIHLSFLTAMNPGFGTGVFRVASTFIITLSVALILSPILKRYQLVNVLFLGGRFRQSSMRTDVSTVQA